MNYCKHGTSIEEPCPDCVEQVNDVRSYLENMDNKLIHRDGSAELTHDEAKKALRDVYLISCADPVEFNPWMWVDPNKRA